MTFIYLFVWSILLPLVLTITIEGLLSFFVLREKKDVVNVVLVQCITNPVLNLLVVINRYTEFMHMYFFVAFLEILVVVVEAWIYSKVFSTPNKRKAGWFSIMGNVVSVGVGFALFMTQ